MVLASTFFVAIVWPNAYQSEAKLLVLVGRESIALDPTAATSKTLHMDASRETEINSVIEILGSRAILEKVATAIGPEVILAPPKPEGLFYTAKRRFKQARAFVRELVVEDQVALPDNGNVEAAVRTLRKCVRVAAPKSSAVISVSATAHSPDLAQQIVGSVVDVYMREHLTLNRTAGSEEFFGRQKEMVESELATTEAKFSALKSQLGIGSIEAERERLQTDKANVETRRQILAREVAAAAARQEALEAAIAELDSVILTERVDGLPNEANDGMRQQLYELEIREREASQRFTADHPVLRVLREQLANLREVYQGENAPRTQTKYSTNPERKVLELDFLQEAAQLAAMQAEQAKLDQQHEQVLLAISHLNEYTKQYTQLEREIAFLEQSFATYSDSLEQSRIDNSLKREEITNVNIAQQATYQREPVSPRRTLLVGAGLLLACLAAVAVPLTFENLNRKLRSPAEIEAHVGVPVLMSLPLNSSVKTSVFLEREQA